MSVFDLEQTKVAHFLNNFDINQNFDRKLYTLVPHLSTKKLAQIRQPVIYSYIRWRCDGLSHQKTF